MQPPALQDQRQDIVNRLNQVNNILVTVKANPTVDELSAALGLTMALNNYGKHATAVFSGKIPNAMSFLKPQKTFENNVHSLRDFIISLNKEKADKLRFAKDGEIVKIYITPYKSTITPTDLEYSEGDFNVEMVIAVGINVKEELDAVIAAHGRILHEATVATVMPGSASQLGSINWSDPNLTSSSAMALQLIQSLGMPNLLSPEVSTALLTGIVADTDRFSNTKTSPKVMELSAQLMNAGANHLLVTSSIGASRNPSSPAPTGITPAADSAPQDLILDLHDSPDTPQSMTSQSPISQNPSSVATNTSPMVNAPAEPVFPTPTASTTPEPQVSPAIAELLPPATDPTQAIIPVDLLPPKPTTPTVPEVSTEVPPLSPINTPSSQTEPLISTTQPPQESLMNPVSSVTPVPDDLKPVEEDIRSEIDKIYSAESFDPANNPRQDLGTDIVMPQEDQSQDLGSPSVSIDTTVQESQANPTVALKPIEATRNETVDVNSVLGTVGSPTPTEQISTPEIPGLELPPEITPPPPPPNPLTNRGKTSSIDTEPFGNTLNFDPTKSNSDAT